MKRAAIAALLAVAGCGAKGGGFVDEFDLARAGADLAMGGGCAPRCTGLTPHCNDARRCVGCVSDDHCMPGTYCKVVSEAIATCVPGCKSDAGCGGKRCCDGQCVDTMGDARHCGGCGKACAGLHAVPACVGGQCRAAKCDPGWGDCNNNPTDGCETNLHVDPNHCTACGMKCAIANAINACADGCYATACQFGWDDCNFDLAKDGCETSVLSDPQNCGGCKKTCTALPNATALCVNGACALGACKPGFTDCDGDPKTGCESDVNSDAKNCGACGKACPLNLPGCLNGVCVMSPCLGNPNWMRVSCTTGEWVWSMDKTKAKTLQDAAKNRVLTTGCGHAGAPQPQTSQGLCSLDGKGWVSTKTFTMANCNTSWYHIGGRHTGDCGGHDGDTYRLLVLTDNDCYSY